MMEIQKENHLLEQFEKTKTFKRFFSTLLRFDEDLDCFIATEKWRDKEAELLTAAWWMFAEVANPQAAPEWISVNDKMPDEGDEVFVHHYGHIVQATKDQKYSGGFKQRNCYGWEAVSSYISHWMPMSVVLPESYHFYYGKPAKKAQEPAND